MKKTILLFACILTSLQSIIAQIGVEIEESTFTIEFPDLVNNDFGNLYGKGNWSTKVKIKRDVLGVEESISYFDVYYDTLPFGKVVIDDYNWYGNFSATFVIPSEKTITFLEDELEKEITLTVSPQDFTYKQILVREVCFKYSGGQCVDRRTVTYAGDSTFSSTMTGNYISKLLFYNGSTKIYSPTFKFSYDESNLGFGKEENAELDIYPNPTSNWVNLAKEYTWTLMNASGNEISTGTSSKLNLENQNAGVYFLKTLDENGFQNVSRIVLE